MHYKEGHAAAVRKQDQGGNMADIAEYQQGWTAGQWRYHTFKQFCKDKIVADAACGAGYGSYILAELAKKVYGYELSQNSLICCERDWMREGRIEYKYWNLNKDDLPLNYDVIVSSETIEHLDAAVYTTIDRFASRLNSRGILCLTHPENQKPPAEFHLQFEIKNADVSAYLEKSGFEILLSKIVVEHESSWIAAQLIR